MFPPDWELSEQMTVEFCNITRFLLHLITDMIKYHLIIISLIYIIYLEMKCQELWRNVKMK